MHAAPAGYILLPGTHPIGAGLATEVFAVARDGQPRLCKRLGSRALAEPWMRERLAAEGRLLGLLAGRGAPRLVDAGEDAAGPWLVMERLAWPPLAERRTPAGETAGRDPQWLAAAATAAFEALVAVHAAGAVHGDVSPANVLVAEDAAHAALVDFGLALGPSMPPLPAGPFRGTLLYAAPEVARGEPFDRRADLFAMAASLLHVWSGEAPRAQATPAAMLLAAGDEAIDAWARRAARGLPPETARALVARCAFDAADRLA
jgi:serine/threonine-protein kinase